jgi:O-antigen/teichoic acid export membrane protein
LAALLNIVIFVAVPLGAVGTAVVQAVAVQDEGKLSLRGPLVLAGGAGLVGAAALSALSPLLAGFLHLRSVVPVVLLAAWLMPSVAAIVPSGVLSGRRQFRRPALAQIAGSGTRLAVGVTLVGLGTGVAGAASASTAGATVGLGLLLFGIRSEMSGAAGARLRVRPSDALRSAVAAGGLWLLLGVDGIWARHFLGASPAGFYTAADTAARSALFLPGAVAAVLFPRLAATRGAGRAAARALGVGAFVIAAIALATAAVLALFPGTVIALLFGAQFSPAAKPLALLGVAAGATALVSFLMYFHLARRSLAAWLPWAAVGVMSLGIVGFHSGPQTVALVVTMTSLGLLAAMALPAVVSLRVGS